MQVWRLARAVGVVASFAIPAAAQEPSTQISQDLKRLTIEELAEIDVTSVSRRPERLAQTAAAVTVLRQDDLRRAGVATLADAMRLATGLDVARVTGRSWAVSARGFTISTANKLLVLLDGRTLYSPLFSGTFWDVQDALLADIDRIEVIRGPGGSTWGANAVNGVVNIISRDAAATRGTAVLVGGGNETQAIVSARHGGRAGAAGSYRVYGKYRRHGANRFPSGSSAEDPLQLAQGGFRVDSGDSAAARWSLQGDLYRGSSGQFDRDDTDVAGGNVLGRWTRRFSQASELRVLGYYDATYRKTPLQFEEMRHTVDVDTQHRMQIRGGHDLIFGGALRVSHGRDEGEAGFVFDPEARTNTLFSVFVQDEVQLQRRLFATVGSKFERNDYTGFELQPTVRVRWSPDDRRTLWGAVSRAVRLPTRLDVDFRQIDATGRVSLTGTEAFDAESVVAFEGGYRLRPAAALSLGLAAFLNRYDNLRSQEAPVTPGDPVVLANMLNARTTGAEVEGTIQILDNWRVLGSYTYLHKAFSLDPGSRDRTRGASEANDPPFFASIRSHLDLPRGLALDAFFRHLGRRPAPVVPAYSELDVRFGWAPRGGWELSLIGQNLLHARHLEFRSATQPPVEFERGVYLRAAWRF